MTIVDAGPTRLILLDSLVKTNETPGLLGKVQRDWLKTYLAESDDTPLLLCFHHSLRDTDGDLLDSPRLFEIIEPVRKVKALVYGHSHDYAFGMQEGIALINLPAVGYSFNREMPVGWVEANLSARGGQFTLHAVAGNTSKRRPGDVAHLADVAPLRTGRRSACEHERQVVSGPIGPLGLTADHVDRSGVSIRP